MTITKDKLIILLNALDERYKSMHIIRERVQVISIWILGFLITGSAWIYQSEICFILIEKVILVIIVLCVWVALIKFYFNDLEKGFNSQRRIAAKLERALGFYEKGYFLNDKKNFYPKEWQYSGEKNSEGKFISNTLNLIAIGFVLLILSISAHGYF